MATGLDVGSVLTAAATAAAVIGVAADGVVDLASLAPICRTMILAAGLRSRDGLWTTWLFDFSA